MVVWENPLDVVVADNNYWVLAKITLKKKVLIYFCNLSRLSAEIILGYVAVCGNEHGGENSQPA